MCIAYSFNGTVSIGDDDDDDDDDDGSVTVPTNYLVGVFVDACVNLSVSVSAVETFATFTTR